MKSFQRRWEGLEITIICRSRIIAIIVGLFKLGYCNFSINHCSSGVFG